MPKPEETHKTHSIDEPKAKPPKRKVRHPLLAKVGAGLVSMGLLFGSMGKIRADVQPNAPIPVPPTVVMPSSPPEPGSVTIISRNMTATYRHYEVFDEERQPLDPSEFVSATSREVVDELGPLIQSSQGYVRGMETNKPTNWRVRVSPMQEDRQNTALLLIEIHTFDGIRTEKKADIFTEKDRFNILEVPDPRSSRNTMLIIVDPLGVVCFRKNPQTGELIQTEGLLPIYFTLGPGRFNEKPLAIIKPIDDGSGLNVGFLPRSKVHFDSSGNPESIEQNSTVFITSLSNDSNETFIGFIRVEG